MYISGSSAIVQGRIEEHIQKPWLGDLKVLLPDNKQIVLSSGPLTHKLKKELSTFCDDDYLLLIGDPAIIALAGAIASEMNRGKFKVLKWDRDEKKYYDLEIDLRG